MNFEKTTAAFCGSTALSRNAYDGHTLWTTISSTSTTLNHTVTGLAPSFGSATINEQADTQKVVIEPLRLPAASGGDRELIYALTLDLSAGLTFDGQTQPSRR